DNVDCGGGTLDTSVAVPVVKFSFPIKKGNAYGSNFLDINYTKPPVLTPLGVKLRKNIYVQVAASNLTSQGAPIDQLSTMLENGARFYFPAFCFIEQQSETFSTYHQHCVTRLCEYSTCSTFKVGRHRMHSKQKSPIPARSSAHVSSPGLIHSDATGGGGVERDQESTTKPSVLTVAMKANTE
ncbi:hypothetical protein FQN60_004893, partial [Etheostoma spectabile]